MINIASGPPPLNRLDPQWKGRGATPIFEDTAASPFPISFAQPTSTDFRRPGFHGIICRMRRAGVATIAKVLVLVALPILLAWGGWVLGATWHPVMVPCRYSTGGPIVIGGTCFARPFWTRPEVLEAIGAATGLIVVAIMLIALRRRPVRLRPNAAGLPDSETLSVQ
jgi:hypothetical protein